MRAWEIWNEPNLSSYWKTVQAHNAVLTDPFSYAALANAAAYQIRHNDPGTKIITGGLAPMFDPIYPKGISQGVFLSEMLPRLDAALFDGVGIHPYSWPALPSDHAIWNAFYTVDHGSSRYNLREIMIHDGWGDKQIWGTEFGAPTTGVHATTIIRTTNDVIVRPDHVTETKQAEIISQGIRDWYAMPDVGPLFVHSDSDQWLPQIKNEGGFGLRRFNGTKKPAYTSFKNIVRALHL